MTVTKISQIYGVKVNKIAFLEWCIAHPESEWTKKLMTMNESARLDEYIQFLKEGGICLPVKIIKEEDEYFDDYDWEIFGYLGVDDRDAVDGYGDVIETFGMYVPTHDQQEVDGQNVVIVGVRVSQVYSNVGTVILCNTQLPFQPNKCSLKRANEILVSQEFTKEVSDRGLYLVQNFCSCCT